MRFPIFNKHLNFLTKKSYSYVRTEVECGRADWIADDQKQGIVLRSRLIPHFKDPLERIAGSGFDTAWSIRESGHYLVWQLKTQRSDSAHASAR